MSLFCGYCCVNFAGVLVNRAVLAADWVANLAASSRRWSFCFLNLLNLALSPFCDDICPRSSNLFVTQHAKDESVRSSIRQATDGRCEAQGALRTNPLQRKIRRLLESWSGQTQEVQLLAQFLFQVHAPLPLDRRQSTPVRSAAAQPLSLAGPIARRAPWLPTKYPAACQQHILFLKRSAMSLRTQKVCHRSGRCEVPQKRGLR